jgi:8-oxo-dGTP pyrophosphatase MutT (NUDIX family)
MDNLFRNIKVKSLAWIEKQGMIFVVRMPDSVKMDQFYRPIGGSVEYGETSLEAVIREVKEELQTEIQVTGKPLILENLFTCDGKFGHEIDFIYPASFVDSRFYENKSYRLIEADGCEFTALWIPISDCLNGKSDWCPNPFWKGIKH